jgi:branched-chain amino acid transport system substrate-binding protein
MRGTRVKLAALAIGALLWGAGSAGAQQKEVFIGMQCDRTGATQITGVVLCPAMHDYYDLVNSQGGVEGYKIKAEEIDNEYKVPQAVEAYQRHKQQGAVLMTLYGTPMTVALNQRLQEDKMPTTSPGFGISAAADGKRYPYLFPIAATYWSQGAASVAFVKDKLGGNLKGKKIAYIYYDNPAGHEPLPIIEELQKKEGFELRTFAVPPPGIEVGAQVLDIAQRFRPDFVIAHLFGRAPGAAIKASRAPAIRCRKWSAWCGPPLRPTSWPAAGLRRPKAITRCSSPVPATTTKSARTSRRCTRKPARSPSRAWTRTPSITTAVCCRRRSMSRRSVGP